MRMGPIAILAWAVGCGQEYGLSPAAPGAEPSPFDGATATSGVRGSPGGRRDPRPAAETPAAPSRPGAHRPRHPRPEFAAQEVPLGGGATTDVVDFLFVVDHSSSMNRIVDQVFAGFDALAAEDAFPRDARIAVTSTLPADPDRPSRPHPAANKAKMMRWDPGFQRLVSAEAIAAFREEFPGMAESFALDGCGPWFAPAAKSPSGASCFAAHTQLALVSVGTEAGLTATQQLLSRAPLFRTGAAANVVFVSDTQDPGVGPDHPDLAALLDLRPTAEELLATAAARQVTSSLRLHAIAPQTQCGSEPSAHLGDPYGDAARATDGRTLDICAAKPEDYVTFVREIVADGSVPTSPVVPLARPERIRAVFFDGREVPWHLSSDQRAVVVDRPMPAARTAVRIEYRAPAARAEGAGR